MSIGPDEIGLAPQTVEQIYADGCRWHDNARDAIEDPRTGQVHPMSSDNLLSEMPGLQDVCRSPAVHGALQSLLGKGCTSIENTSRRSEKSSIIAQGA